MIKLVYINPALTPCNLLDAAYAEALTVLNGSYEVACFEQAVAIAGIEPGKTASEEFHTQRTFFKVEAVQIGNLVFATGRRLQARRFSVTVAS